MLHLEDAATAGGRAQPGGGSAAAGLSRIRDFAETMEQYSPSQNRTSPLMTKFERAKVLGLRTEQLARGAEPMIQVPSAESGGPEMSPSDIALEELRAKATPYIIVRNLPDGRKENWKIADMIVIC